MDKIPTELEMGAETGKGDGNLNASHPDVSDSKQRLRRRLLVTGAIAAPVILTFRSTSAWAVSAGCLVQNGTLPIPGAIIRVDENLVPIPKIGGATGDEWYEQYEVIQVLQDPGGAGNQRVVNGSTDIDRLRALVFNQNIGATCLQSIVTAPPI